MLVGAWPGLEHSQHDAKDISEEEEDNEIINAPSAFTNVLAQVQSVNHLN